MHDDVARSPEDLTLGAVTVAIACILLVGAVIAGVAGMVSSCSAPQEQEAVHSALVVEAGNAAEMHAYGLPTKADVMEWHLHGQWAYMQNGVLMAFDDLPGSPERWDAFYGIAPNPAFDK